MDAQNEEMDEEGRKELKVERADTEEVVSKLIGYLEIQEGRQKEFRDEISEWLKKNEFSVRRGTLREWAHVVQDHNKIHIYPYYARKAGFETTIIHGTLISAHYEDYILGFLGIINNFDNAGKKLVYTGQRMKFQNPLYPHGIWPKKKNQLVLEKIVCLVGEDGKKGIDLVLSVVDPRRDSEEQIIVPSAKASFRYQREQISQEYITSFLLAGDIVERSNMEITDDELKDFNKHSNRKVREEFPMMYGVALEISTILKLASRETGKPKGTYLGMKLDFYNDAQITQDSESVFKTTLRMPIDPRYAKDDKGNAGYVYMFKALTLQEGKIPILEGTFSCFAEDKLSLS